MFTISNTILWNNLSDVNISKNGSLIHKGLFINDVITGGGGGE